MKIRNRNCFVDKSYLR